jgi:hypothetical protein
MLKTTGTKLTFEDVFKLAMGFGFMFLLVKFMGNILSLF